MLESPKLYNRECFRRSAIELGAEWQAKQKVLLMDKFPANSNFWQNNKPL